MTSFLHPTSAIAMPSKPTMAPTRNGAFSTSTSSVALRLATSGLNSESRMTVSTFRPMTPPSALTSSTAICVAASISCASSAIGPVCGTTTPSFRGCSPRARRFTKGTPEAATAAPAPARLFSTVRRVVRFIVILRLDIEIEPDRARLYHARAVRVHSPGRWHAVIGSAWGSPVSPDLHVGVILALTIRGLAVVSYEEMRRVAATAEELGFDSVWLCDHFLTLAPYAYVEDAGIAARAERGTRGDERPSMPLLECWTALSALSRDTRRLRLGTSVLCHSYRSPSVLAKMAATLDVISEGRLDLGLGAGWFEQEYRAYGIPFPRIGERIDQLAEGVEIIRRMWTDAEPRFAGRHYAIDGAVCDPPPVQRPHPPIWIGGEGDRVHRLAARAADGINVRWWGPERIAARAAYLDAACRDAGRDPRALRRSVTALCLADRDRSRVASMRERFTGIPAEGHVAGTPAQCLSRLRQYVEAGARHILLTVPDVASSDGLELVGREVLPALRHEFALSER